jgi:hypothetical protein
MPERRRIDKGWGAWTRAGRDVWLFVVTLLVLISVKGSQDAQRDNRAAIRAVAAVVKQIQLERERNTRNACVRDNRKNREILGFIQATVPPNRRQEPLVVAYLQRAARTFPQRDCEAVVRGSVKATP